MVKEILRNTGIKFRETVFKNAPSTTYAIYTDSITRRGGDTKNMLNDHRVYIELYSNAIDEDSEKKLEVELDARCLNYNKSERVWFDEEQKYQVIYDFNYIERRF